MICQVCGKTFEAGFNPTNGIPYGIALKFPEKETVFDVCSNCVMNNTEDVITLANMFKEEANEDTRP